jgi:hypothetical protein
MGATQRFQRQAFGQATGIRDLQAIGKEHHQHAGVAGVVAMSDRIDDSPRPSEAFPTASGPMGRWAECGGDYSSGVLSFMRTLVP